MKSTDNKQIQTLEDFLRPKTPAHALPKTTSPTKTAITFNNQHVVPPQQRTSTLIQEFLSK